MRALGFDARRIVGSVIVVEDVGLSEEIVERLPPNVPGGIAPPGL